jgi:hypothetical protein
VAFKWNSQINSTLLSSSNNDQNKVVSLLIPTYINGLPRLDTFKKTIESIVAMEIAPQFDCVIVDNSDKWVEEKKYPRLIRLGFSLLYK